MRKREFLVIGAAAAASPFWLAGCRTTSQTPSPTTDPAELRRAVDAESDAALARLYHDVNGSREVIQSAAGVLVLPNVVSGGLIFGAAGGNGVLRVADKSASYWRMSEAQVGLLGGGQSQSIFVVFLTPEALASFTKSSGWTAGFDKTVAVSSVGKNGPIKAPTQQQPIAAYVLTNAGLMAGVSFQGTKFTRLEV
ncbi:MAG: putative lipoprotein [Burkholderiaceae bacterium]|jgi:lipid-binding SYLF domain-containing protein|nr:putative lipoprotein [Burkholderiaceae bacterium]